MTVPKLHGMRITGEVHHVKLNEVRKKAKREKVRNSCRTPPTIICSKTTQSFEGNEALNTTITGVFIKSSHK